MRGTDRYIIVFATGIVLLIVVALVVASIRPDETYLEGDGPEIVAHNYLLALEQGDYTRAYSYLSPNLKGYPSDQRTFVQDVRENPWLFPSEEGYSALTLLSVKENDGWADARVRMTTNAGGGLFGFNRNSDEVTLQMEQTDQGWKIAGGARLFVYCWSSGDCQ
ncbi:MAG: hypothetical protein ACK2UO_00860 [Caldilineaceae bacterium]